MSWKDLIGTQADLGDPRGGGYLRWLGHVAGKLESDPAGEYTLKLGDEHRWAEEAVAKGYLRWGEKGRTVRLGLKHKPSAAARWLTDVRAFLVDQRDAAYQLRPGELEWARAAVLAGQLAWAVEGETVRLSGNGRSDGGPYR